MEKKDIWIENNITDFNSMGVYSRWLKSKSPEGGIVMKHPVVLFETISEIVGGKYVFQYEDALKREDIRKQVSAEIKVGKDPALDSGTGHLMVKGWEEGVYYPYPLLFWSHADRTRAAEHYRTTYGGDQHFYIPSDDEVFGRVKEIEDYILMMEQ